jgi:hypothetical protein
VNDSIYKFCEQNGIIESEQKGCKKGELGCKHHLTIDSIILKQAKTKQRNLHIGYIDYSKAFDSVPHDWLAKVLGIYKICPKIRNVLNTLMKSWRTNLYINNNQIANVKIQKGIFQGGSLSPIWFCLAINPLSTLLKTTKAGYKIKKDQQTKINHLLFMDDVKLYAESKPQLQSLLKTVKIFSDDIKMKFGIDKCATININRGITNYSGDTYLSIEELAPDTVYKYLGMPQNSTFNQTDIRKKSYHCHQQLGYTGPDRLVWDNKMIR